MPETSETRQLVVFSLGEEEYALPITLVQEIIFYTEPRAVSSDVPWIRGVISLRGKIIPVYDLAARLGLPQGGASEAKIVIVERGEERAGVIVDDVTEVLTIADTDFEQPPAAADTAVMEAIAHIEDRLVVLLSLDGLVVDKRLSIAA